MSSENVTITSSILSHDALKEGIEKSTNTVAARKHLIQQVS